MKKQDVCCNCAGECQVSVSIPCPVCEGEGLNEIDELRRLAKWVEKNFAGRSRAPSDGLAILCRVHKAQGKL